ncbi:MAG: TIGR03619 family F420-dependent LLM class oxidoreductase [Myxococcota bacterium]
MRFSLGLPVDRVDSREEFGSAEAVMEMAAAAERAGFDAVYVTDHPVPECDWLAAGGHQTLDPFVALAFAAAATQHLRLQTNLCVLPYRNPYLAAKSVASLDSLSDGRVLLGVGAGYLAPEFAALGADFAHRNELCDEAIVKMKQVWSGAPVRIGAHEHRVLPRPRQEPHPPIWGGGNSRRAIRRAVELCDGWMPFRNPQQIVPMVRTPALMSLDDLRTRLAYAHEHAERLGRPPLRDVMFSALTRGFYGQTGFDVAALLAEIEEQEELGVTQMAVGFERVGTTRLPSRRRLLELIEGFGSEVISKQVG